MNKLEDITHDEIFNKIMLILCANKDIVYNQYKLYDIVASRLSTTSTFIPHTFKYKFIIVLRQLMSSIDNVKVNCINDIYYATYKFNNNDIQVNSSVNSDVEEALHINNWISSIDLSDYIFINDLYDEFTYKNPESGNTIYHDVLGSTNILSVKKLVEENYFDYNMKNNKGETPIDCIKSLEVSNLIVSTLSLKVNNLEVELAQLELRLAKLEQCNNIKNEDISIKKLIKIKMCKFIFNYGNSIIVIIVMLSCLYKIFVKN